MLLDKYYSTLYDTTSLLASGQYDWWACEEGGSETLIIEAAGEAAGRASPCRSIPRASAWRRPPTAWPSAATTARGCERGPAGSPLCKARRPPGGCVACREQLPGTKSVDQHPATRVRQTMTWQARSTMA